MVLFSERIDLTINIRTFESSSLFVTLPPGISISQILDNHEYYQMQEAYTSIDTRHSVSSSSTPYAGLKSQHVNTMPFSKTVNGNGMSNLPHHLTRPRCAPSSHHAGPVYCPPAKAPQDRRQKATGNDSDVDMVPMRTNKSHKPNSAAHRSPPIHTQSQDALDPPENNPSQVAFNLQGSANEPADSALEPSTPTKDSVAANVGDPRLADQHIHDENDTAANVGDPRLAPAVPSETHVNQPSTTSNNHASLNHDAPDTHKPNLKNDHQSKACQRARVNPDAHATGAVRVPSVTSSQRMLRTILLTTVSLNSTPTTTLK